ncbi:MAG: hypothetical protein K9H16_14360 [Bacteroidales bacterium]|nr:hypothetical protein [Bacteroidales bacterium]
MKTVFYFSAILLVIFTLAFSSCKKDEIETVPLETVNGDILEYVNYGKKVFLFNFNTDLLTYPITYLIRSELSVEGNQIKIKLIDIQKDGHDDLNVSKGAASCSIDLGELANGQYEVQITVSQTTSTGTLSISDSLVTIDFPSTQDLTINHDTLNRIPFGTVWGYVGYNNTSNQGLASGFISGLNALGAEPSELAPGYYGYFSISDSMEMIQPIDENFTYFKEYLRDYQGEAAALNEHINYYNTEYYNKVDVIVYWFWDGSTK